jgi:hypothetical protein
MTSLGLGLGLGLDLDLDRIAAASGAALKVLAQIRTPAGWRAHE